MAEQLEPEVLAHVLSYEAHAIPRVCHECEGKGWFLRWLTPSYGGRYSHEEPCPNCGGTGVVWVEVER